MMDAKPRSTLEPVIEGGTEVTCMGCHRRGVTREIVRPGRALSGGRRWIQLPNRWWFVAHSEHSILTVCSEECAERIHHEYFPAEREWGA